MLYPLLPTNSSFATLPSLMIQSHFLWLTPSSCNTQLPSVYMTGPFSQFRSRLKYHCMTDPQSNIAICHLPSYHLTSMLLLTLFLIMSFTLKPNLPYFSINCIKFPLIGIYLVDLISISLILSKVFFLKAEYKKLDLFSLPI